MYLGLDDPFQPRLELCRRRRRELQIIEEHRAGELGAIADEKPGLETYKRHGAIGADRLPEGDSGVAVQPGRHIQREDRAASGVDLSNDPRQVVPHAAAQPGAEQSINNHFAFAEQLGREPADASVTSSEVFVGTVRIAAKLLWRNRREHRNREAGSLRKPREHVAVAAIVAAAADDHDAVRRGPARAQIPQRCLAGALHQCVSRNPQHFDCMGVQSAHLRGGIQSDRQRHASLY